jgi:hypothetical protein
VVGFGGVLGLGTLDMQLARWKLGKKHTPPSRRPPSPYGRHGALLPVLLHIAISQLMRNKSMLLKLEIIVVFTIY